MFDWIMSIFSKSQRQFLDCQYIVNKNRFLHDSSIVACCGTEWLTVRIGGWWVGYYLDKSEDFDKLP